VVQIESEIKLLGSDVDIIAGSFFGGIGYGKQEALIKQGVDVIIGTPGRLIDFGKSGKIDFKKFGHVVIDEADRMFDMGFYPDIKKMMKMMVSPKERRTMLFSATLSTKVMNVAWEFMNNPTTIEIEAESITVNEISQVLMHVSTAEKMSLLLGVLKKENPDSAIIFTNTKYAAVEITERLKVNGYSVHYIMGDLPQRKRLSVINRVKSGEVKFLVATDVAARGLHVNDLDMVINYDIPEDFENYVHRIGRTARAGKSGKAVTFACEKFVYGLEAIEKYISMKIPVEWPEADMFVVDKSAGMNFYREKQAAVNPSGKKPYDNRRGNSGRSSGPRTNSRNAGRKDRSGSNNYRGQNPSAKSSRSGSPSRQSNNSTSKQRIAKTDQNSTYVKNTNQSKSQSKNHSNRSPNYKKRPVKPNSKGAEENNKTPLKLTRTSTEAEKLAYYKNKYGENFKLESSSGSGNMSEKKKKEGFFKKLFKGPNKKGLNK
ncbi:MAG: DEAD/DEAH box helicase, partial [Spirochaetales bacterium]|nr:DEAD/DEAH box helicase [Spirochaetales bacterium]